MLTLFFVRSLPAQRWIAGITTHAMVLGSLYLLSTVLGEGTAALRVGDWPMAIGIVFVADSFAALLVLFASIVHACTFWFMVTGSSTDDEERMFLHPLFLLLGSGVNWAFLTGDLFNLFVSFEMLLLCSYGLLVHGGQMPQLREGIKFVVLNLIASTFFLAAAGLVYGFFGTLNMAELAVRLSNLPGSSAALVMGTLLLLVFASKSAVFPLYFWLPDAYPKAPISILPYFGGILTKVGVYCLFRTFTLMFTDHWQQWFSPLLLAIGAATMFLGVMGAVGQWTIRRILSVHIISQIGYMIFALGLMTPLALAAGIFYIFHNMIVKSALLMIGGLVHQEEGTDGLKYVKGLLHRRPAIAFLFALAAFSLAGIPPLSGFYGKFALVLETIKQSNGFYLAIIIVTGMFTLFSMTKIWSYVFWGKEENETKTSNQKPALVASTALLVILSLVLGLGSGVVFPLAERAANDALNQEQYVFAVLGQAGVDALNPAERMLALPSGFEPVNEEVRQQNIDSHGVSTAAEQQEELIQ